MRLTFVRPPDASSRHPVALSAWAKAQRVALTAAHPQGRLACSSKAARRFGSFARKSMMDALLCAVAGSQASARLLMRITSAGALARCARLQGDLLRAAVRHFRPHYSTSIPDFVALKRALLVFDTGNLGFCNCCKSKRTNSTDRLHRRPGCSRFTHASVVSTRFCRDGGTTAVLLPRLRKRGAR